MNVFKIATLGTATAVLMGTTAMADGHACAITDGRVNIVGNEFRRSSRLQQQPLHVQAVLTPRQT